MWQDKNTYYDYGIFIGKIILLKYMCIYAGTKEITDFSVFYKGDIIKKCEWKILEIDGSRYVTFKGDLI